MIVENISKYLENKGIAVYLAEKKINVGAGTLAKAIRNNSNIGTNVLDNFLKEYNDINPIWLLTNNGNMIKNDLEANKGIPFYDTEVIGGQQLTTTMDAVSEPVEMIDAGDWFKDATGAMRVHGNSMENKYPPGSIIAFKEVLDRELIIYGRDYVIETSEYRILKRIQKNSSKEYVLACSYNEEKDIVGNVIHAPFEVPLKKISRLFEVLGKVEREVSSRIVYNIPQKKHTK